MNGLGADLEDDHWLGITAAPSAVMMKFPAEGPENPPAWPMVAGFPCRTRAVPLHVINSGGALLSTGKIRVPPSAVTQLGGPIGPNSRTNGPQPAKFAVGIVEMPQPSGDPRNRGS